MSRLDDDARVVMATPGPTSLAPIPAVSRGAVVGPARESLSVWQRQPYMPPFVARYPTAHARDVNPSDAARVDQGEQLLVARLQHRAREAKVPAVDVAQVAV